MLEITFSGWIIIGLGIVLGFLMIDTSISNKVRQKIVYQFSKVIPAPTTGKDLLFIPVIILVIMIIVYLFSL